MEISVFLAMDWIQTSLAVFKKDLRIEFRTRFAVNMVLAFVVASLLLILFTLKAQSLDPTPKAGLVWIIILFIFLLWDAVLSQKRIKAHTTYSEFTRQVPLFI